MTSKIALLGLLVILLSHCTTTKQNTKKTAINVFNRDVEQVKEEDKFVYRLSEKEGAGIVWFTTIEFEEGTIEFDVKGRDVLQKSFVGIAFHGINDSTYETVYFRPFNFQSTDPIRHIHAVQYAFEPGYNFEKLRKTRKDEFESAILPANTIPTDWFHVKVEVIGNRIRVFVNGHSEPALNVMTLNPNPKGRKLGYWVGNNSNGDFANLKILNRN
ncbi:hypothetical protein IQ13_4167 [Lacibacter cauensis]|uniref:3-keto-disaccharide hydrolase domain-containing protein n=1 Tax=Lacibacter cauensis TaxID=510947 RepID=A0A562SB77_9BACT|nr:hypothetical protein [Lacibacter cauensis]TWI77926.1 hypothetical protein IQ13_4167 [Lacibacter cauensis]